MNKQYRLKNSDEIGSIVTSRIRYYTKLYNMYYKKSEELKIAVVAGKKCGNSVKRNYEKRVMREIIRKKINLLGNYNIVFVAKEAVKDASYIDKEKDLDFLLNKLIERDSKHEKN